MKKYVNRFIKTFRKKGFDDSVIDVICFQVKKKIDIDKNKVLLPVIYASVSGETITTSVKMLKRKGYEIYSNKKVLDTVEDFDPETINEFIRETRDVLIKVAKRFGFVKRKTIISIDFHNKPFYGDKSIKEVVGTKRKLGTNFAYSYITVCICEEGVRFNLATLPVTQSDVKEDLVVQLINKAREYVSVGLVLLDRGFNGSDISKILNGKRAKYAMPLIENKKVKKICGSPKQLSVRSYTYYENRPREYQKQVRVIMDKRNEKNHYFVTNVSGNERAILAAVVAAYRKRWGIETGYRVANDFYAWTTSVNFSIRCFLGLLSFLMQDFWTLRNFLNNQGTKFQQPRKHLRRCKTIALFIKHSVKELDFYWRPSLESKLFKEDISDCVKKRLS